MNGERQAMIVMAGSPARTFDLQPLRDAFGTRLQQNVPLGKYTSARLGGPADALLEVGSADELAQAASLLWEHGIPFIVLGGGSNVLVSDAGVRAVVLLNRARLVRFDAAGKQPSVWAESGANFGRIAREAAQHGLAGLEWAAGIPGTLGGAVLGNAGAHGGDMAGSLIVAEILHRVPGDTPLREEWTVEQLEYRYRNSRLKQALRDGQDLAHIVLAARLRLERSTSQAVQALVDQYTEYRKRTQPPGASMGSMFKNPPGDYAGRLIEAAGLKGAQAGGAQISKLHANFFINYGHASAMDVYRLLRIAQQAVFQQSGVYLEPEIELLGDWTETTGDERAG